MSEQRLIDAKAYADELWKMRQNYQMLDDTHTADKIMHGIFRAEQALKEQPTVDAVPVGAVEQIRWERDMAMQQLQEHRIPFGGKADDVVKVCRCKDCKYCYAEGFVNVRNVCEKHYDFGNVDDDWFCADGERKEQEQE